MTPDGTQDAPRPAPETWAGDHWSTLLYFESCCVDHGGQVKAEKMRGHTNALMGFGRRPAKYPTVLKDDKFQAQHDDYDCMEDLAHFGFIVIMQWFKETGDQTPIIAMTDKGWQAAAELRQRRAAKLPDSEYVFFEAL